MHILQQAKPCANRKRFEDKRAAQAACYRIAHADKVKRVPVPCQHCNGWHLS